MVAEWKPPVCGVVAEWCCSRQVKAGGVPAHSLFLARHITPALNILFLSYFLTSRRKKENTGKDTMLNINYLLVWLLQPLLFLLSFSLRECWWQVRACCCGENSKSEVWGKLRLVLVVVLVAGGHCPPFPLGDNIPVASKHR